MSIGFGVNSWLPGVSLRQPVLACWKSSGVPAAFIVPRSIRYDETVAPDRAEASARDLRAVHPIGTGPLCAGHPAMCEALCTAAAGVGTTVLRGIRNISVAAGEPPSLAFEYNGRRIV